MSRVEGQKYILLVASGVDTMSKLDLDQILKRVKASRDTTIFTDFDGRILRDDARGKYYLPAGRESDEDLFRTDGRDAL